MMAKTATQTKVQPPKATQAQIAHAELKRMMLDGSLPFGSQLLESEAAEKLNISRTPVREAMRRLVAEGALSLSASGRVATPALSNERIEELASLRALLEPELAVRALPRAHIALIERLETINAAIAEQIAKHDAPGYIRTNLEFHRTLYLRAHAPAMLAMAETVWLQLGPTMRALYGRLRRSEPPQHHRLILNALKAGDEPGLRLAVRTDVTQGLRLLAS